MKLIKNHNILKIYEFWLQVLIEFLITCYSAKCDSYM